MCAQTKVATNPKTLKTDLQQQRDGLQERVAQVRVGNGAVVEARREQLHHGIRRHVSGRQAVRGRARARRVKAVEQRLQVQLRARQTRQPSER
jgi:hypothetical protein